MRRLAAFLVVVAACGDDGAIPADALIDAIPPVGTTATLDIACWNLREFPSTAMTPALVGDVIASLQLDVVTVEEIASTAMLEAVVARLPGWELAMPTAEGSATGGIAVLWNDAIVHATSTMLVVVDPRFPRPVVRATFADVASGMSFALHVVHFKAGTQASEEQARVDQAIAVEANVRTFTDERMLVLGDFNTDFDDARGTDVFAPWTADRYTVISKPVDDAGGVTFLPAGIMLDQMVTTHGFDAAVTEAPIIPPLDAQLPDYRTQVSDHVPLVIRLTL